MGVFSPAQYNVPHYSYSHDFSCQHTKLISTRFICFSCNCSASTCESFTLSRLFVRTVDGAVSVAQAVSPLPEACAFHLLGDLFWQHVRVRCEFQINKVPISPSESLYLKLCQGRFSPFDLLSKRVRWCAERPQCDWALSVQLLQWPLTFKFLFLTGALTAKSSQFSEFIWNKDRCLCQEFTVRLRLRRLTIGWWSLPHAPCTEWFRCFMEITVWLKLQIGPTGCYCAGLRWFRPVSVLHMNRKQ